LSIALSWGSSLCLTFVFLGVGRAMDTLARGDHPSVWAMVPFAVAAGIAAWAVPTISARDQAREEKALRASVVGHVFRLGAPSEPASEPGESCPRRPTASNAPQPTAEPSSPP
jgi:ATP-binding cassette, subfamily C, bacterial CydD